MRSKYSFALMLVFGATSGSAFGQLFSVGVKAGVPLNDTFVVETPRYYDPPTIINRYLIGPQVEVRLPFHLGVEADALYRHYVIDGQGASEWDFPILLKYRFKGVPLLHPFVDLGPIFNHVSNVGVITRNQSVAGLAAGAGIDFHVLILHITPEFRYVHWGQRNFISGDNNFNSNQNQAEFLVGFTF